jgi:hypothetical protein
MTWPAAYADARDTLANELLAMMGENRTAARFMADLLWSGAWCGPDGAPHDLFPGRWRSRREVIGPPEAAVEGIQRVEGFLRFRTTTNWMIDLAQWADTEVYFAALSKKMRKKLGWLRNSYPRLEVRYEPIDTAAQYERFLAIFRQRWPDSDWETRYYDWFVQAMTRWASDGRWYSEIMVDAEGRDVAAFTGYYTGQAYNLHLLCRAEGMLEKYSPGFFLVWHILEHLFAERRVRYCFLGPGRFDYKEKFLAQELPVFRYENISLMNAGGLLKLMNRARAQRRRRG